MGLTASQARLIALTARMSDVEYEGQQINQQRLALSNKISDIYSQMENMQVPTPPSPYDHMNTVYSGKDGNGNPVDITPNSDGSFSVGVPTTGDTLIPTNNSTAEGQVYEYSQAQAPEASNTIEATYTPEVAKDCYKRNGKQVSVEDYENEKNQVEQLKNKVGNEPQPTDSKYHSKGENDSDVFDSTTYNTDHNAWAERQEAYMTADRNFKGFEKDKYYVAEGTATTSVSKGSGEAPANYAHAHGMNPEGDPEEIKYKYTDAFGKEQESNADALKNASSGYSKEQIQELLNHEPPYFTSEQDGSELKESDFDKSTGKLNEGVQLFTREEKQSLGGSESYSYDDADAKFAKDPTTSSGWADVKTRVQNYLKGFGEADQFSAQDCEDAGLKFTFDGKNFHVFQDTGNADNNGNKIYKELNFGEGTVNDVKKGTPTFSASGNLKGVTLADGSEVKASKGEELNQVSYGAAMAEYEAAKAEYDQEQKRLNNETSKIQLEDKKLDLKLKRLDTERNALNTEIDAVKKVIQDAVDHGFKTFSG